MEKRHPPEESAPPYPGPPLYYGNAMPPQPGMYPQDNTSPEEPQPPPAEYQVPEVVVVTPPLNVAPGQAECPYCHQTVLTVTEHIPSVKTWAACCIMAFFGCFLCCCIPFCLDSCRSVEHRCPSCHKVIYIYN